MCNGGRVVHINISSLGLCCTTARYSIFNELQPSNNAPVPTSICMNASLPVLTAVLMYLFLYTL